ncbi:hypothetical protein [Streptomyces abikoensis]|uniref:hypothetical protein n=1 Tax=Streptomyces abikoensis TaxID=97398 RepID=UPI00167A4075|nr:hypothetical protein [Streptomyces abikoensis]GGP44747.1 hypothetical protein GCM10010214_17030 [Streptomyces abikoensis]
MPKITALQIDLDGTLTELDLTDDPRQQAKTIARALLDAPTAIARFHRRTGCLAVIAGMNRAQSLPNFHAGVALEELTGEFHDAMGTVIFTGYHRDGELTTLPHDVNSCLRTLCPCATS